MSVGYLIESMMISVCWAERDLEGYIKTLKFVQFAASHMLAITNLAICVNLALIVSVSQQYLNLYVARCTKSLNFRQSARRAETPTVG